MGFVSLKCPDCGASIQLDDSREFGFCSYCGAKIVQDRIIVEHRGSVTVSGIADLSNTVERAYMFLEDGDFTSAAQYFEKALDIDAHCSKAYLGKLLCRLELKNTAELASSIKVRLDRFALFEKARRFANEEEKAELEAMEQAVSRRVEEREQGFISLIGAMDSAITDMERAIEDGKTAYDKNVAKKVLWIILAVVSGSLSLLCLLGSFALLGSSGCIFFFVFMVIFLVCCIIMCKLYSKTDKKINEYAELRNALAEQRYEKETETEAYSEWKQLQETYYR